MNTINEFDTEAGKWILLFNAFCNKHGLKNIARPDHICYKCDSAETFETLRRLFEAASDFIYQSIISKRRIAYIRFKEALETDIGAIRYLELSDQKPDGSQTSRFDHIELYSFAVSYEELVGKLEKEGETVVKEERPHHTTHGIEIGDGFSARLTRGPLIAKIKQEEML